MEHTMTICVSGGALKSGVEAFVTMCKSATPRALKERCHAVWVLCSVGSLEVREGSRTFVMNEMHIEETCHPRGIAHFYVVSTQKGQECAGLHSVGYHPLRIACLRPARGPMPVGGRSDVGTIVQGVNPCGPSLFQESPAQSTTCATWVHREPGLGTQLGILVEGLTDGFFQLIC